MPTTPRPLYLAGPTGSGKSEVALALAERIPGAEIVNADAYQIYRGYEILSAAPDASSRERAPHHLYGVLSLEEACDAARYAEMARPLLDRLIAEGKRPLVVGGSGLYLKALTHGLSDTPPADPALRARLDDLSHPALVDWFRRLDPQGAETADLQNRRYLTRYLEISLLSGRPSSELRRGFATATPELDAVFLTRDRPDLYERINERTSRMFSDGVVEEIRALDPNALSATARKAIGLQEVLDLLEGKTEESNAVDAIRQATRRYAKRQGTWFRREKVFQSVCLAPDETPDSAANRVLSLLDPGDDSQP